MDYKNYCCTPNLLPDKWIVEKDGYHSPNSIIQDIMAFLMNCKHEFFMPMLPMEEAFSPYICNPYGVFLMPHQLSSPRQVSDSLKERIKKKKTKEGRGYMSHSPTARRANILVKT